MDEHEYLNAFIENKRINRLALKHALDIRKFEIELYWKRATYFWTFIGATLGGYISLAVNNGNGRYQDYLVILACLGSILSYAWFCANKGSKQWQENWENHVDMLEDGITGPLYKTILERHPPRIDDELMEWISGPGDFSVSKINQLVSLFVTFIWVFLLFDALDIFDFTVRFSHKYMICVSVTLMCCFSFHKLGKTHFGKHAHRATQRKTEIAKKRT